MDYTTKTYGHDHHGSVTLRAGGPVVEAFFDDVLTVLRLGSISGDLWIDESELGTYCRQSPNQEAVPWLYEVVKRFSEEVQSLRSFMRSRSLSQVIR